MLFFGFGLLFGFILSRAGATDYDAIAKMFLLEDLHLMGVIGVAILVAGPSLRLVAWLRQRLGYTALRIQPKAMKPGQVVGGLIFGAGWALTGTCPGTGLAQLGEGKWMALFTVGGIFLGTWLYRRFGGRVETFLERGRTKATLRAESPL